MDTSPKSDLLEDGWRIASVTGGTHLNRTLEMYHELGFEVHLEEIDPAECFECTECYKVGNESVYRIYTRSKDDKRGGEI